MSKKEETAEKIMIAAIDLMAAKGYNGVTTAEIATTAGFTEKTLFRHFQSKQNLLETAFHHYHYADEFSVILSEHITWDLYTDLLLISQNYHRIMFQNRKLILISSKEHENLPGLQEATHRHPQQLKKFLTDYFEKMYDMGKIIDTHAERQAVTFLYMNYGAAMGQIHSDPILVDFSIEAFIEESVAIFTRGLAP